MMLRRDQVLRLDKATIVSKSVSSWPEQAPTGTKYPEGLSSPETTQRFDRPEEGATASHSREPLGTTVAYFD